MAEKKTNKPRSAGAPKRRRKPAGRSLGLGPAELDGAAPPADVEELGRAVERDGPVACLCLTYHSPSIFHQRPPTTSQTTMLTTLTSSPSPHQAPMVT